MSRVESAVESGVGSGVAFPLHVDGTGRTAWADADDHVRTLIELVLMTEPGERVMRPDFGCGLRALVFAPLDDVVAQATQALVLAQLRRWLDDVVSVDAVQAEASTEGRLEVTVVYHRRGEVTHSSHSVSVGP